MNTAAGLIGFVCVMLFRSTDFPTVFHDTLRPFYKTYCYSFNFRKFVDVNDEELLAVGRALRWLAVVGASPFLARAGNIA